MSGQALWVMAGLLVVFAAAECGRADGRTEQARFLGRKESWDYAPAMRKVVGKFRGTQGVVLHLGDSITYASPYTAWARAGKGKTKEDEAVLRWSHCGEENDKDGWYLAHHDLPQGRSYTAAGGMRADQYLAGGFKGMPSLDEIISKHNPQAAIVMLGTNDAWQGRPVGDYAEDMERIVSRLLANGTVVILSTIPPLVDNLKLCEQYNAALWKLSERHKLPVIDYYGEIVARRAGMTWNGTLLEKNDGHPSADRPGATSASEPTPENLRESGYLLRGWLSVRKLAEVKKRVFDRAHG
jgi:lysophospholipase L1-like esterase